MSLRGRNWSISHPREEGVCGKGFSGVENWEIRECVISISCNLVSGKFGKGL